MTDGAQARVSPHVVIVGGGISGLAAAFYLRDEPVRVTVALLTQVPDMFQGEFIGAPPYAC